MDVGHIWIELNTGKLNASESGTTWQDSHMLVILTAGACLLALIIALKSILDIPVEQTYYGVDYL